MCGGGEGEPFTPTGMWERATSRVGRPDTTAGTMSSMSSIIGDLKGWDQMETTQTMATLGAGYHQCRVARRGRVSKEAFDVSVEGAGSKHKIKPDHLSGFDSQFENAIEGCFIATRNNQNCKQNISCTFDPRDLSCVTCNSAHPIVETRGGGGRITFYPHSL